MMRRLVDEVRWWAAQVSGDARYAAYVDRCRAGGADPMTRRAWERHRSDHRDSHPQGRCC